MVDHMSCKEGEVRTCNAAQWYTLTLTPMICNTCKARSPWVFSSAPKIAWHKRKKAPLSAFSSSGVWIRTKDLRVMSEKPVSATSDLQARTFDPARRRVVPAGLTGRDWLVVE